MSAVIGNYRCLGLCICFLDGADLVLGHIYSREAKVYVLDHVLYVFYVLDYNILNGFRNGLIQLPAAFYCLCIGLACRTGAGCDLSHFKPGMIL